MNLQDSAPAYAQRLAALASLESMLRKDAGELIRAVDADFQGRLAIGPVVCALAAGNRVLVKMSEAAPPTSRASSCRFPSITCSSPARRPWAAK